MKIKLNGQTEELNQVALSVSDLLKLQNVEMPEMVSVEHNGEILDRSSFDTTSINDGDAVEFLYFMGGGEHPKIK